MSCCACPPSWPPAQGGSANKSPSKARRQKGQNDRRTIRLAKENDKKEQGYMSLGDKATAFFRFTCLSLFEIQHVDGSHLDVYQRVKLQLADLPGSSL